MHLIAITTTVLITAILPVIAIPPLRRDEWQPSDPNQDPPQGADIASISSTVSVATTTDSDTTTETLDSLPTSSSSSGDDDGDDDDNDQTCIYLTASTDWAGEGFNLCNPSGQCAPKLPDGLTAQVLSAGPSPNQICFLFSDENCQGDMSEPLIYPGYADLNDISFANKAKSWNCWVMQGLSINDESGDGEGVESATGLMSKVVGQTTPGGLPVSTISVPGGGQTMATTTVPVQTTTPGGLPVSTVALTDKLATATVPGDSGNAPTDVPSSVPDDSPTDTDDPSGEPTTDNGVSDAPAPTMDGPSNDPETDALVDVTVTHTFADGETVVTTL